MSNTGDKYIFYHYDPSLPAAAVFAGVFVVAGVLLAWRTVRAQTWILVPMIAGALRKKTCDSADAVEAAGYMARIVSHTETPDWTLVPFIVQAVLLLVAPALFAATICMVLGRVIFATSAEHLAPISRRWLTKLFVGGDVACFIVQAAGSSIQARAGKASDDDPTYDKEAKQERGKNIVMAGLILQIVVFAVFAVVALAFHGRLRQTPTHASRAVRWQRALLALYASSILITARNAVRLAEYVQGPGGFLLGHEVFLYVCDGVPMTLVAGIFVALQPGAIRAPACGKAASEHGDSDSPVSYIGQDVV